MVLILSEEKPITFNYEHIEIPYCMIQINVQLFDKSNCIIHPAQNFSHVI